MRVSLLLQSFRPLGSNIGNNTEEEHSHHRLITDKDDATFNQNLRSGGAGLDAQQRESDSLAQEAFGIPFT